MVEQQDIRGSVALLVATAMLLIGLASGMALGLAGGYALALRPGVHDSSATGPSLDARLNGHGALPSHAVDATPAHSSSG